MIKQSSAGIYSWLPLGFKVMKKIEQIVREEQNFNRRSRNVNANYSIIRNMEREVVDTMIMVRRC